MHRNVVLIITTLLLFQINPARGDLIRFDETCKANYIAHHLHDSRLGLVDGNGNPVETLDRAAGIDLDKCYEVCGPDSQHFDINDAGGQFTTWLLPWLALTAQLTYEGSSGWINAMSLLLMLGSPMLLTHSLALTILNGRWLRKAFAKISLASDPSTETNRHDPTKRVEAVVSVLQESQQIPIRLARSSSGDPGLTSNSDWWVGLASQLSRSRRGVTFSVVAQIAMASIAWIFTVVEAFSSGQLNGADVSSSTIWLWMIPVIVGWIIVGTQKHGAIEEALASDFNSSIGSNSGQGNCPVAVSEPLRISVQGGLGFATSNTSDHIRPGPITALVCGDELISGPLYNYARFLTWWTCAQAAQTMIELEVSRAQEPSSSENVTSNEVNQSAFDRKQQPENAQISTSEVDPAHTAKSPIPIESIIEVEPVAISPNQPHQSLNGEALLKAQSKNEPATTKVEIDPSNLESTSQPSPLRTYTPFAEIPQQVWNRWLLSTFAAMLMQWGTTGASLMMAYLGPTVGLGCRSGSWLLYGILATASFVLLQLSWLLSHAAMLRYQEFERDPRPAERRAPAMGTIAVIIRRIGKSLAAFNAVFLVLACLFEYSGFYSNCWCNTNVIGLGDKAFITLFTSGVDWRIYWWVLFWSTFASMAVLVLFLLGAWLLCRDRLQVDGDLRRGNMGVDHRENDTQK